MHRPSPRGHVSTSSTGHMEEEFRGTSAYFSRQPCWVLTTLADRVRLTKGEQTFLSKGSPDATVVVYFFFFFPQSTIVEAQ